MTCCIVVSSFTQTERDMELYDVDYLATWSVEDLRVNIKHLEYSLKWDDIAPSDKPAANKNLELMKQALLSDS